MGRIIKKGEKGAVTNFINRNQAIKKLQLSLADFRRICILKGIYPREPRNKKKVNKGSTAPTTFYYTKDIRYLLHEPILAKFRDWKAFAKKMTKVLGKGQYSTAKSLEENNKPTYTLNHIIKERYPSFIDALRDLDDALSMIFLFATMPSIGRISVPVIERCQRLSAEFQYYVMHTHSLRKTFISFKGIYYQVEIKGQTITWIVPHSFNQEVPSDVDFKVMATFLELYEALIGFVMFKLYSDINLRYPPLFDVEKDNQAAGVNALTLEGTNAGIRSLTVSTITTTAQKTLISDAEKQQKSASAKRIKTLPLKLAAFTETENDDVIQEDVEITNAEKEEEDIDEFMDADADSNEISIPLPTYRSLTQNISKLESLFSGLVFFLAREVPKTSLEFVIRSFGGIVGWDAVVAGGSPITGTDKRITHNIVDRHFIRDKVQGTVYVQPQWVYDCINVGKLLSINGTQHGEGYGVGNKLPAHLSPFVELRQGDYDPRAAIEEELTDADEEMNEEIMAEPDHECELEAELKGISYSEFKKTEPKTKVKNTVISSKAKAEKEENEQKQMSKMLMSNRQRTYYDYFEKKKKKDEAKTIELKRKRKTINEQKKQAKKSKTT